MIERSQQRGRGGRLPVCFRLQWPTWQSSYRLFPFPSSYVPRSELSHHLEQVWFSFLDCPDNTLPTTFGSARPPEEDRRETCLPHLNDLERDELSRERYCSKCPWVSQWLRPAKCSPVLKPVNISPLNFVIFVSPSNVLILAYLVNLRRLERMILKVYKIWKGTNKNFFFQLASLPAAEFPGELLASKMSS